MSKLLKCPFCGGEAVIQKLSDSTLSFAVCVDCRMRTPTLQDGKTAMRVWNTRKPMANIVEKLEERRIEYELSSENAPDAVSSTYRKGVMRGYEYSRDLVKQEINNGLE